MINLMALRPSQWDRLEEELASASVQEDFLSGLQAYLGHASLEDGVDKERVYVTAVNTENVNVWNRIATDRLVNILKTVDLQVAKTFVSGLAKARRLPIIHALESQEKVAKASRPVAAKPGHGKPTRVEKPVENAVRKGFKGRLRPSARFGGRMVPVNVNGKYIFVEVRAENQPVVERLPGVRNSFPPGSEVHTAAHQAIKTARGRHGLRRSIPAEETVEQKLMHSVSPAIIGTKPITVGK